MNDVNQHPNQDDATVIRPMSGAAAAPSEPSAPDGGNALPVGSRISEFEITRVVGEGGFGIVYLARDHALQRWVALKEYMPSSLAMRGESSQVMVRSERHRDTFAAGLKSFINEARLLAQFDHRSLVKVYRFWEADGTAYMVMPYVEGQTLKQALRELGQAPDEAWLMTVLEPLTEALQVLHAENCYHRDVAPDNIILLNGSGLPLLLDFGAARRVIGDMTQALTVILKPGYAPIEQYAEVPSMRQGPWTDVYALAAVVYFAITGRTPPASVGRLVSDDYVPLTQCAVGRYSDRMLQAVDRALRVKPEDRTASIAEFRSDLGLAGGADAVAATSSGATLMPRTPVAAPTTVQMSQPTSPASAVPPQAEHRRRWLLGAVLALALGLVVVGGGLFWRGQTPPAVQTNTSQGPAVPEASPPSNPVAQAATQPPATVSVPPPVALDTLGQFDHVVAHQTADFQVVAQAASQRLRIDKDELRFSVRSARDGYVYVLLYGPDGMLSQIYPNAKVRNNRIKAGQSLQLPQASWPLKASEPAGMEHFLVLVSSEPRTLARFATGKDSAYGFLLLPTVAPSGLSEPNTWLLGEADCGHIPCDASYGAARFSVEALP